ncbi:Hypothetical predicted protein, partial [Paramuricea clavata]
TVKECMLTNTSGHSTLEELQGFIDRSYQNADNLENLLVKTSTVKESTPMNTSGCSTLEELEGFIDRSYQNVFPQNGKISFPQSIDSSTPFRLRTVDSVASIAEQFNKLKEN